MKLLIPLFILISSLYYSQTNRRINILDKETGNPISNARLVINNIVFYSNSDGILTFPYTTNEIKIFANGYENYEVSKNEITIKLKPYITLIEEVVIKNVDVKQIFEDVLKNIENRYYTQPSLYDIIYHQKYLSNNKIIFLLMFEGKLWSKSNRFDGKLAARKKYDEFVQMEIDEVRFLKSQKNIHELQMSSLESSKDFLAEIFFSYRLTQICNYLNSKSVRHSGRLLNESAEEKYIYYELKFHSSNKISGKFTYNKKDKVISYLEFNFDQSSANAFSRKTKNGQKYLYKVGNGTLIYDFIKVNEKYIPALFISEEKGYTSVLDNVSYVNDYKREIIFKNFSMPKEDKILNNKINFSTKIWEGLVSVEDTTQDFNLAKDELDFIKTEKSENN